MLYDAYDGHLARVSEGHARQRRNRRGQDLATAQANGGAAHGLKYSLFYGRPGERIVGYDNASGKGDHRHHKGRERPYRFTTFEKLLADFWRDVNQEIENERG